MESVTKKNGTDPLKIGDHTYSFHKFIGALEFEGRAIVKDILLLGLSHIHRNGDVVVVKKDEGMDITVRFGDDNMKMSSELDLELNYVLHQNLTLEAKIRHLDVKFSVAMSDGNVKLEDFDIDELKGFRLFVHGLHILDPIIDVLADGFVFVFNKQTRGMITKVLRPIIEEKIHDIFGNSL